MTPRNTTVFWFVGVGVFVTLSSLALGVWTLRDGLQHSANTRMQQDAAILTHLGQQILDPSAIPTLPQHTSLRLTVLNQTGQVVADSHYQNLTAHEDRPEIQAALSGKVGQALRFSKTSKEELQYTAFPIQQEEHVIGVSRIAIPTQIIHQIETDVLKSKAPIFGLLILSVWGLLAGAYFANKRHVQRMVQALKERHAEHVLADIPDIHNHEIQDVCIALTEKLATELAQKELALEEKKAILDHLTERVLLVAPNDEILHLNPAAKQLFSISNAQTLYVSHTCRNSVFLDTVKQTLNNQVVNNKRIVFHTPTGPISLMVTGVPILLNKQVHALLLLATPTYTWMPTYTKLIQLWIEKQATGTVPFIWLQTLNDTHTKLCKSSIIPKKVLPQTLVDAIQTANMTISQEQGISESSTAYLMEVNMVMSILIAIRLYYPQASFHLENSSEQLILSCQWECLTQSPTIDSGLSLFIEALGAYFHANLNHVSTGVQILFKERETL